MGKQPFKEGFKEKQQQQRIRKVIELYKSGLTFREVSKALKISHETARQIWLLNNPQDVIDTD